jgi:hypothetical protein
MLCARILQNRQTDWKKNVDGQRLIDFQQDKLAQINCADIQLVGTFAKNHKPTKSIAIVDKLEIPKECSRLILFKTNSIFSFLPDLSCSAVIADSLDNSKSLKVCYHLNTDGEFIVNQLTKYAEKSLHLPYFSDIVYVAGRELQRLRREINKGLFTTIAEYVNQAIRFDNCQFKMLKDVPNMKIAIASSNADYSVNHPTRKLLAR